jgi:urease subunit gamma/beta
LAQEILTADDVLPEVPEILTQILVEARFDDGTRLVVVQHPFGPQPTHSDDQTAYVPPDVARVEVTNMATTAIGITSHIHMAEVNPRLRLDRSVAYGMRPAHPTGVTVWLEAGESVSIPLTPIEGQRIMIGNTGVIDGPLDDPDVKARALATLRDCGYLDVVEGSPVNEVEDANGAVSLLMERQ